MKSIYEIFNNAKIDTSPYDQVDLSEIEKKQIKKRILGKVPIKKKKSYKLKLISSVAILLIGGTILFSSPSVIAKIPLVGKFLEEYLISNSEPKLDLSSFEPYRTVLGQSSINQYGKIVLNEVILDEGRLIISATLHGEAAHGGVSQFPTIVIDGKKVRYTSASGTEDPIDENTSVTISEIDLEDISLKDEHHIQLSYIYKKEIDTPWEFEFKANGEALSVVETEINQSIRLENGQQVHVEKIVQSPLSIILYYKMDRAREYHVQFKAFDEEGNELLSSSSSITDESAILRFYTNLKEIKRITLSPYVYRDEDEVTPAFYEEFPENSIEFDLKE